MKLYAPAYYRNFNCIADKCTHSCCIGWEIDVDAQTCALYDTLDGDYADTVRASIDDADTPHFTLGEGERCPHLDERGLCRIISAYGQSALCEICREHPRFYHETPHGTEVGLGLACEEACRIVLFSDNFDDMTEIGETDGEPYTDAFDATVPRARVYEILKNKTIGYEDRLARISAEFGANVGIKNDNAWCELLAGLEYLQEEHIELFMMYAGDAEVMPWQQPILANALAYFVYRHCSDAASEADFASSLGLALFLERLLASLIASGHDALDAARIISEEIEYSEDNTDTLRSVFYEVIE